METKNLAIMFTDIKGFTSRTSVQSREQIENLLDQHESIVAPVFKKHNGIIVKTIGDAFMVTFTSPTDAVLCGLAVQDALRKHNETSPEDQQFHIRVGINAGEVNVKSNDVFGEAVNIASRIEGIAEVDEVYFTEAVYLAMNKAEIPSSEVGVRHLKGIPEQIKVYKVLREEESVARAFEERKSRAMQSDNIKKGSNVGSGFFNQKKKSSPSKKSFFTWKKAAIAVMVLLIAIVAIGKISDNNNEQLTGNFVNNDFNERSIESNTEPDLEWNREITRTMREIMRTADFGWATDMFTQLKDDDHPQLMPGSRTVLKEMREWFEDLVSDPGFQEAVAMEAYDIIDNDDYDRAEELFYELKDTKELLPDLEITEPLRDAYFQLDKYVNY